MDEYMILWGDMHSNLHHESIGELAAWAAHARGTMDFWPIAYYPYYMRKDDSGLPVEDCHERTVMQSDWEKIRSFTQEINEDGFPMFMGYEWQGAGLDGDHNVFFRDNDQNMMLPLRYAELLQACAGRPAMAVPHHTAYQPGYRGKNWDTQDDSFSPVAELFSSHGSSESDMGPIGMERHIHMGPRTGVSTVERGWEKGRRFGVIAAGDNHSCPGVYGFGSTAVLAKSRSKEDIWEALRERRVYGVSKDRIRLAFTLDGTPMGGIIKPSPDSELRLDINAGGVIDRVEIIKDNIVAKMIPHTSTWEREKICGKVRFKFQLEFGWGPDRRVFPDIACRLWTGSVATPGKLVGVEKCWSNFGQSLTNVTDHSCDFSLTTYKTTATGKWMGPSAVTTEGFLFEIEDEIDSVVNLVVDGRKYDLPVRDILQGSSIIPLLEDARLLLEQRFGFREYYRSDPWWQNSYKIKVGCGAPESAYTRSITETVDTTDCNHVRVRVWQKNGSVAWSSPIFVKGAE